MKSKSPMLTKVIREIQEYYKDIIDANKEKRA